MISPGQAHSESHAIKRTPGPQTSFPKASQDLPFTGRKLFIMSATGTYRGTPKGRGQVPFSNSPSNIPRPALESHPSTAQSDAGSGISASRQKQSKRDEVSVIPLIIVAGTLSYYANTDTRPFDGKLRQTSIRKNTLLLVPDTHGKLLPAQSLLSSQAKLSRSSQIPPSPKPPN